jgi:RNA polymerase sigma-70 factor, ECF subfamily
LHEKLLPSSLRVLTGTAQPAIRPELLAAIGATGEHAHRTSKAQQFGIERTEFDGWVLAIAQKYLPADAGQAEAEEFLRNLRVEDLVLARACAAGHDRAWEQFMARFRELLYDAALGIAKESSQAKDLADSVYADLYGMSERDRKRVSKLSSYTGRGSLEGWLRTVIAQEFINRYRSRKRLVSLEEEEEAGAQFTAADPAPAGISDSRVDGAVDQALAALDSESRAILSAYYLDGRKLAEIGRMLGFHEATASRKLDRICKNLRKSIREGLIKSGMSKRQADEALETDVRDLGVDVRKSLAQENATQPFLKRDRTGSNEIVSRLNTND